MLKFTNGLIISGNPQVTKTNFGVKITNDSGLNMELSKSVWESLTMCKMEA
jgi:hypothetical protein